MSLILKVDCVQIPVPDLDAGLAFYRDRLGHALIWRTAAAAGLRLPESDAELVLQTERPELEPNLLVASVDQAVGAFAAAGGSVLLAPFPIAIGRCAVVVDPWDNRLVLLDAGQGTLVTDCGGNVVGVEAVRARGVPLPEDPSGPLPGIVFRDSAEGLTPDRLCGFFAGWRREVSAEEHLRILRGSAAVALAIEASTRRVVGFVTAISDGVLCAHLTSSPRLKPGDSR